MVSMRLRRAAVLLLMMAAAPAAQALCTVTCSCTVSATPVAFAPHNPLSSANNDSVGTVSVSCGGIAGLLIPFSVALSSGNGANYARTLMSGGNRLAYNLYTSNAYTTVWGDGTGATGVQSGSILLNVLGWAPPQQYTVYGRIPGSQTSTAPGSYGDTVVVTLTYY